MSLITNYINIKSSSSEQIQRRYIVTGGPGVGKTTIINFLEAQGYAVIHEAATDIIEAEKSCGVAEP